MSHVSVEFQVTQGTTLDNPATLENNTILTASLLHRSLRRLMLPIHPPKWPKSSLVANVIRNTTMIWVNELNYYLRVHREIARKEAIDFLSLPVESTPDKIITELRLKYSTTRVETLLENMRSKLKITQHDLSQEASLYLGWDEIVEMQRCGISFGNHTMAHPNLAALAKDEQRMEIARAQEILVNRVGEVTSLAYPFGHRSKETADIASGLGLTSMAEVGGTNLPLRKHKIGRVHVSATKDAGLFAQMEVVEPVKTHLRRWLRRS